MTKQPTATTLPTPRKGRGPFAFSHADSPQLRCFYYREGPRQRHWFCLQPAWRDRHGGWGWHLYACSSGGVVDMPLHPEQFRWEDVPVPTPVCPTTRQAASFLRLMRSLNKPVPARVPSAAAMDTFPRKAWREAVAEGRTFLGYDEWAIESWEDHIWEAKAQGGAA